MDGHGKRSPVAGKVQRQAGESIREKIDKIIDDDTMPWAVMAIVVWFAAFMDLLWFIIGWGPQPLLLAIVAAVLSVIAWVKVTAARGNLKGYRLGLDGEVVVSQTLERLRAHGYEVFHDIQGDGFNIDHVVVGPGGVFVIETKTARKAHGSAEVRFDGEKVTVGAFSPDRDPVEQVRRNARDVRRWIREATGIDRQPQCVVVYPGWFTRNEWKSDVWVLEEKGTFAAIKNEDTRVPKHDVRKIAEVLRRLAKK